MSDRTTQEILAELDEVIQTILEGIDEVRELLKEL